MTAPVGHRDRSRADSPSPGTGAPRRTGAGGRARQRLLTIGIPALAAYVPLLLTHPGMVGADTKTYLYLDPGKLLADAPYVWDSQIGLGTVTHQNIGYLFPMGPFYLLLSAIGLPDWVAQRLWLGSVLFAAAMGVRYLLSTLADARVAGDPRRRGGLVFGTGATVVACLAYELTPYLLDYSARISVILLPWAALGWLIALCARSVRHGGWRYPALFAFVMLAVGGINATAIILMGFGPLLWIIHAVFVDREESLREALAAVGRIAALTLLTSLWWIAGLWAEGRYGLPVLRYTESYRTVATVSSAPEVLRGLGYWFFYGTDKLGPWIEPSVMYTQWLWLLGVSYLLPVLALVSGAFVRWRYRAWAFSLIVVGTLVAVAGHPWDDPSLLGRLFQLFTRTNAGLSLRSTPRAVPLIVLGIALLLGAGVDALARRLPRLALPATALVGVLIVANIPPMWTNQMVAANLERPEEIPSWWRDAAAWLDARGHDTRVLEIPGTDFASYRWGNTVDPVTPGLMGRGYVARELFQWGSPQSANLLNALDHRLHEETFDPEALAVVARMMGVGDIAVRSDLQYERYRIARPRQLWDLVRRSPGLGEPVPFGPTDPNRAGPLYSMIDEVEQGTPIGLPEPPRVAAVPVTDPRPIIRTQPAQQPLLLAGDGDGIVDAAAAGLLSADQAVFYSASLAGSADPSTWDRTYGNGADLLVTDTNRRRAHRWGALRESTGYTERAGEFAPTFDPSDARLAVFPGAGDDSHTLSDQRAVTPGMVGGVATATSYGNPITYTPDDRPANAFDGDPMTAWRAGTLSRVQDLHLDLRLTAPVTTDRMTLLQPITLDRSRWITGLRLTFTAPDGTTESTDVRLDDSSRSTAARFDDAVRQVVTFPSRTFTHLDIEVTDTNVGMRDGFAGLSGIGLAEVGIPGVEIVESIRPPVDLLTRAGASSIDHRLSLLFTRLRSNPAEPVRSDEERALRRLVSLPTARSFSLTGQARISGVLDVERPFDDRPNNAIDRVLGLPDHTRGGVTASADGHLPGSLRQRASASIDGDPATWWSAPYLEQEGRFLEYRTAAPLTFDHLDLVLVNDGRHSVPRSFRLSVDGTDRGLVEIPATERQPAPGGTVSVRVPLPAPVTGSTLRFTVEDYERVETTDWYSDGSPITMPVAVAEIGVPGLHLPPVSDSATFDSGCRSDLLDIDGRAVPVRVTGSMADALDRRPLAVETCTPEGGDAPAVSLDAGDHVLRTSAGADPEVAIDLDRLVLRSERGGAALDPRAGPVPVDPSPAVHDPSLERVDASVGVAGSDRPYWLVLGQSWSPGWEARVNGRSLGPPTVVNGFANAWYVDPAVVGTGPVEVHMTWTPQALVWACIGLSVLGGIVCLVLIVRRPRRLRPSPVLAGDGRPIVPVIEDAWPFAPGRRDAVDAVGTVDRPPAAASMSRRALIGTAVALGVFAAVNLPMSWGAPLLAIPLAMAFVAAARSRRGGTLLAAGAALTLAAAGASIVGAQWLRHPASSFQWPTKFGWAHILGLVTIMLLAGQAVLDLRSRRATTRPPAEARSGLRGDG